MITEIQFGDYTAEPRGNGSYYLRHSNGGGAMATLVEVALIKELIEGREQWAAMKTVADNASDTANTEAMELVQFRQAVAATLPATWYADAPLEDRVKLLVEQWQTDATIKENDGLSN